MEVVDLSMPKYPNRDALRQANDIYLDAMRPFIIHHLKRVLRSGEKVEDLIADALKGEKKDEFWRTLEATDDTASAIDFSYFPLIISDSWTWNNVFAQQFNRDLNVQSMLWLIKKGRNSCEHRGTKDLDSELVRMNLYLIADVLGKIKRTEKQHEVEVIRDGLDDTPKRLAAAERRLEAVEAENAEYGESLSATEKRLADAESKNSKYEKATAELSKTMREKEKRIKKLLKQQKEAKAQNEKSKKDLARTKRGLGKSQAGLADHKTRLKTTLEKLKQTETARDASEKRFAALTDELTAMRGLFTTTTVGNREVQAVFPPFGTDSAVRILDRRGTDKRNYLLALLEQKQPTLIYVQSEEKIDQLLTLVGPEKATVIGKRNAQTSAAEDAEILEKLRMGKLVAIVSDTTFSTSIPSHCVEHFVFCHLAPSADAFFDRCQPAFTSEKDSYLHLIYESKQNVEDLAEKYPNEKTLRKLYQKFRDRTPINTEFINPDNLYNELCKENELDITNLGVETGFSIFEELEFLEQNEEGIRRLSTPPRKLEESKIYCRGKKLKEEIANSPAFQHEHSIEQIWEKMLEELNIDSEQTLRESGIYSKHFKILEKDSDTQLTTETEQDQITPPTPDVWPQRSLSPFDALRQRAAKSLNNASLTQFREDGGGKNSPYSSYEVESTLFEDEEDYENRYNLAMEFAQEYGISSLEQGIAQLVEDRDNQDYDFTEDETNMLLAFQDALRDFRTQSEQSTEGIGNESAASGETAEAHPTPKSPHANARVTEEQVPLSEIRREVAKSTKTKSRKKKSSIAERYVAETTVEDRDGIAAKVVELRINATGSKPLAWKKIREKLGLKNDQFHEVIRKSEGYRKAVIQRIKSLRAQEGGWEYNGKLENLTGIELTEKELK